MAKIVPLFSSSKGNSFYIQGDDRALLVDAGRNCKQIELMMMRNHISMNNVCAVLVTHEHVDHCSALMVLLKRYKIPMYATAGTIQALIDSSKIREDFDIREIDFVHEVEIEGFRVNAIETSHDAQQSCGYSIITPDTRKVSVITDTGIFLQDARVKASGSDFLVIESNHDIRMLDEGPYPYILKRRIKSVSGHLSNDDCARELPSFVKSGVKQILLAHLSEENNLRSVALKCAKTALLENGYEENRDYIIDAAPVESIGKSYSF